MKGGYNIYDYVKLNNEKHIGIYEENIHDSAIF